MASGYSITGGAAMESKEVLTSIIANARQYGIDTDKFCFDIKARERMKSIRENSCSI